MQAESVARRYARALYDVVPPSDRAKVVDEIKALGQAFTDSGELRELLANPAFSETERHAALNAVYARAQLSEAAKGLVNLLVERGRGRQLDAVANALSQLADEEAGIERARIVSAHQLAPTAVEQITTRLGELTGKKVEAEVTVDPELIGGVTVYLGSVIYDGSLKGQLERLKDQLAS